MTWSIHLTSLKRMRLPGFTDWSRKFSNKIYEDEVKWEALSRLLKKIAYKS